MRITIACAALLLGSVAYSDMLAQGQIQWGNNLPAQPGISPQVRAPIYGVIPGRETTQLSGNSAMGLPAGNQDYGAAPLLAGTGFTVAIFFGRNEAETRANLQHPTIGGSTTFRTAAAAAGLIFPVTATATLPGTEEVSYQFRAWDNRGGTITSWAQVMASGVDHGESDVYVLSEFGGRSVNPVLTHQFRSFNLVQVPEPSLIALGALALGWLLLRRRK
jgi:hypothetical protein